MATTRSWRIASFNLFNLNEPGLPMYRNREGWSKAAYEAKLDWGAQLLRRLQADVVGLQELWHRGSLERMVERAGLQDAYELLTPENATGQRIVCAALVRKGWLRGQPSWVAQFPKAVRLTSGGDDAQTPDIAVAIDGFSRPVLQFSVKPHPKAPAVRVYVCHFKSKAPTQVASQAWFKSQREVYAPHAGALGAAISTIRRTAEATALRWMVTEATKGSTEPVVVLGDINDGQHSNTANILTEQPTYLTGGRLGGRDTALYTAQTLQQYRDTRDVYYTHVHKGIRESLDHILLSEAFYDHSKTRVWLFDGLQIVNDHLDMGEPKTDGSTDHGVICATLRYQPMPAPRPA
jgi:predicted extracellular nuclease